VGRTHEGTARGEAGESARAHAWGVISDILFRMGNRTDERELVEWELSSLSLRASPVSENPVHETTPVSPRPCNVPSSLVCRVLPLHRVLRLRCSRNVAPVPVAVTMVRCAQRPPQYPRGTPSPPPPPPSPSSPSSPSSSHPAPRRPAPPRALRSGSKMDRIAMKGIRSRTRICRSQIRLTFTARPLLFPRCLLKPRDVHVTRV
jgi:hypothetical protein